MLWGKFGRTSPQGRAASCPIWFLVWMMTIEFAGFLPSGLFGRLAIREPKLVEECFHNSKKEIPLPVKKILSGHCRGIFSGAVAVRGDEANAPGSREASTAMMAPEKHVYGTDTSVA